MHKKGLINIILLLIVMLWLPACESSLYPPTDAPTLSNIVLTSDSYRDPTTTVREGDTVFVTVEVSDPEDDPETLYLNVLSGGSSILSEEISCSCIADEVRWEAWFDSSGLPTGPYSISLAAEDTDGNISGSLSKDFDITSDETANVLPGDITVILPPGPENWTPKNDATGEPFTVDFTVTNNFTLPIDILKIPIDIEDSTSVVRHREIAIVTSIDNGDTKAGQLRFYIPDTSNPDITGGEAIADTANMEIVIY